MRSSCSEKCLSLFKVERISDFVLIENLGAIGGNKYRTWFWERGLPVGI